VILDNVIIRPFREDDRAFVMSTWMRGVRAMVKQVGDDRLFSFARPIAEVSLQRDLVLVSCDIESPTTIYGWICHRHPATLWAHVIHAMRGNGIYRRMKNAAVEYSQGRSASAPR
jgi:hypothetical protein